MSTLCRIYYNDYANIQIGRYRLIITIHDFRESRYLQDKKYNEMPESLRHQIAGYFQDKKYDWMPESLRHSFFDTLRSSSDKNETLKYINEHLEELYEQAIIEINDRVDLLHICDTDWEYDIYGVSDEERLESIFKPLLPFYKPIIQLWIQKHCDLYTSIYDMLSDVKNQCPPEEIVFPFDGRIFYVLGHPAPMF